MKIVRTVALAVLVALSLPAYAQKQSFDISAGGAARALREFGRQAGVQLLFDYQALNGVKTRALSGSFEVEDALRLLLEGTGLSFGRVNDRTLAIHSPNGAPAGSSGQTAAPPAQGAAPQETRGQTAGQMEFVLAQSATTNETQKRDKERKSSAEEASENVMVVTGTNIRGGGPVGQQVEVITREDMIQAGVGNMNELRTMVTQHFGGGGASPAIFNLAQNSAATTSATNSSYNSSFNLRGLGTGATLSLLNGRRVAPSGSNDTFGIRAIPLNLVERVEIVPDGGSAVYGSDAVGGVVNVITRSDFTGMEATARYGAASGGYDQSSADLIGGHSWGSGSATLYLNYAEEGRLDAGDRDYISLDFLSADTTLLPSGDRKGAFASVTQNVTPQLRLGLDALWSEDNTLYALDPNLLDGNPGSIDVRSRASHLSLRADYALSDQWELGARMEHSINENLSHSDNENIASPEEVSKNFSTTFELALYGPAFGLPAGDVRMAMGALTRKQEYRRADTYSPEFSSLKRDVTSGYAEFLVPLASTLKLNLAARWDDYETFGDRVTPKYGLSWQATPALGLRASYSRAFRAPTVPQLSDNQRLNFQSARWIGRPAGDQDPRVPAGQSYVAVFLNTGNPALTPETATIMTAGFDIRPSSVPRLRIGVTYFDIAYDDIIFSVFPNRLNNPTFADFVTPYPSVALLQSLMAEAEAVGNLLTFPIDLDSVQALLDGGAHNMSSLETSGFDVNVRYGFEAGPGRVNLTLKSSYILDYVLQATRLSPLVNNVDKVGDPLRLTIRTSASYGLGPWMVSLGANHAGAYTDDLFSFDPPAPQPIAALTTFDVGFYYEGETSNAAAWTKNLSVALNVRNVTDRNPPYMQDFLGFNFDAAHGDPVGRFTSLQVTKRWGR